MRILTAITIMTSLCSPALSDTTDVFPMQRGITYDYQFFDESRTYDVLIFIGSSVDSGFVRCIVTDSTQANDSTLTWTITQQRRLYHRYIGLMAPDWRDTTFWTEDTISFSLLEYTSGRHLLITPSNTNKTWNFSRTDSLNRFADSSDILILRHLFSPPPFNESGGDSLWLSDISGMYRRRSSTRVGGNHSWTDYRLEVSLLQNPTVAVRENKNEVPDVLFLQQNYPNPFNPATTIVYDLSRSARVILTVYDILGRQVVVLMNGIQDEGRHINVFDASTLSTGTYFLCLETPQAVQTKKMMLIK